MEVRIGRARRRDIPRIMEIELRSFPTPWSEWAFRRELKSKNAHLLVAKIGREVVGYLDIWIVLDEAHITNIAVAPEHRRKGIGEKLMRHALEMAKSKGVRKVTLEVRQGNIPAQNLYRKFGFKLLGVRKEYYTDTGEDALIMGITDLQSMEIER
ncbi:TPA: ribosomal-protein-alanine N-acetyltransferase [Candidatus Poribacteria bacterium]|nr:ribosomal-protein-alanine N-acetyltransferase [Candidatus Poribacteria bacterium]